MTTKHISPTDLKTDPVLAGLLPIDAHVLAAITESMHDRGFDEAEPIVVWAGRGVVVDGHTRLQAALAAALAEVAVVEREFADEDEAVIYAVARQKHRRNLTPDRLMALVTDIYARVKRQQGGDHKSEKSKTSTEVFDPSSKVVADHLGISKAQVERIVAVAAEPEIAAKVANGQSSVWAAYEEVREAKQQRREAEVAPTKKKEQPLIQRTVHKIGKSEISGIYTVSEWGKLTAGERKQLLDHCPHEGEPSFNRTNDNVEWALWTWNPVTGCLHNCPYCYARDIAARFYTQGFVPAFIPERLGAPGRMKVPAAAARNIGEKNVFVCSMADLFGKWVPQDWIDAVLQQVRSNEQWNFLFLTKFPRRLSEQEWPDNAWVGTTVDKQFRVEIAERSFRNVKAGVKWLSCEPMLERLTFSSLEMFDWVVVGGSSKSTQTPEFNPPVEWFEHLLKQARDAGCKVYLKPNFVNRWREYPGFDEVIEEHGIDTGWVDGEPGVEA